MITAEDRVCLVIIGMFLTALTEARRTLGAGVL